MVPELELDSFVSARERAAGLAAEGKLAEGYTCLLNGWEQALATRDSGSEWGADLAFLYLIAMDSYCAVVGVQPPGGRKVVRVAAKTQRISELPGATGEQEGLRLSPHAAWFRGRRRRRADEK